MNKVYGIGMITYPKWCEENNEGQGEKVLDIGRGGGRGA